MASTPFALAINCVDGRVQRPLLQWVRDSLSLEELDCLTVPGPDAALCEAGAEYDRARKLATFLAEKREHACALVAGHWDCLGNPVGQARHREQIVRAAGELHGWGIAPRTLGLWIDEGWEVSVVTELEGSNPAERGPHG